MTVNEAYGEIQSFYTLSAPTEAEQFAFVEACEYLLCAKPPLDAVVRTDIMLTLGSFYYENRQFDLALKYYGQAEEAGSVKAAANLGYVWYYGRTGRTDYEKAFHYFSKAMAAGDLIASYKVADMYKNGHYVPRDMDRYRQIIRSLYPRVKANTQNYDAPVPEVYKRLAEIELSEGSPTAAISLYRDAIEVLGRRIGSHSFFGDLVIMDDVIEAYRKLVPCPPKGFDLFDLFHLLKSPCTVSFQLNGESFTVQAVQEDGFCSIHFGDAWYRTPQDFFQNVQVHGVLLTSLYPDYDNFEVK